MHSPKNPAATARSSQLNADAVIETGSIRLPFSSFASTMARQVFLTELLPAPAEIAQDPAALRAHYGAFNDRLRDLMLEKFKVEIRETEIAGVPVHRVTASGGGDNSGRLLVNLHGGGFMWGSGSGALVEAIPVAAATGLPVIAVDYRLAPEHTFPAAAEDVEAVYKALLANTPSHDVGMFGCSAGAILVAQCMARFQQRNVPSPGAIAMIGGGGLPLLGDSVFTASAFSGEQPAAGAAGSDVPAFSLRHYLGEIAEHDPRVAPAVDARILGKFPPSLLIAGSRDFAASSVTTMHRRLVAQKVRAELFIFDGLWHAFHIFPDLPESSEVYGLLADFFDRTLLANTRHPHAP